MPISVASLVTNLIEVPVTLMLLSAGVGAKKDAAGRGGPALASHLVHALREPVVWAPLLALALVVVGVKPVTPIQESLFLLGQSTGGVALFASGIVLFSRRVAISLPTGISVLIRNIIVRPRLGPFFWARASSLRQREKPCSPSRCRRRRSV
jgi:malonate transporter and related proteins